MQPYLLLKISVVGVGLVCGLLLAFGVDRKLGWRGVVTLASLCLLLTSVLSLG